MNKLILNPQVRRFVYGLLGLCLMASCSSQESTEGEAESNSVESLQDTAFQAAGDTVGLVAPDTTVWPDAEEAVDMEANTEGASGKSSPAPSTSVAEKPAKEEVTAKPEPEQKKVEEPKAEVAQAPEKKKEAAPKTAQPKSGPAPSTTALTNKLNDIYAMKVSIGEKLDCMRVKPIAKIDRVKAGQLHDKYVGVLPQMLPWVRFEGDQSRILKKDPEKLEKLNALSDKWMKTYKSIDNQANDIMKKYKQSDFYGDCIN